MASIYNLDRSVHKRVRTKYRNDLSNVIAIAMIMVIGFLLIPHVFAQPRAADIMMEHMRFVHSQLANNIQEVMQLVKANDTTEALNLLDGMKIKIDHMNTMFDDLVWEMSNRGH
jgi:hypothetical protein